MRKHYRSGKGVTLTRFDADINGSPYVLRDEMYALRNNRSFAGISGSRLELLEDRLKSDIINELKSFDGRLLCHQEHEDGTVVPAWETASEDSIKTLRETMASEGGDMLEFYRLVRVQRILRGRFIADLPPQPLTPEKV